MKPVFLSKHGRFFHLMLMFVIGLWRILHGAQTQEVHGEEIITNDKHRRDFKLRKALQ